MMDATRLGAALDAAGAKTVLIPHEDGSDYIVATLHALTVEVWYSEHGFRALIGGPGVARTFTTPDALLDALNITPPEPEPRRLTFTDIFCGLGANVRPGGRRVELPQVNPGDMWACNTVHQTGRTFRVTQIAEVDGVAYVYGVVQTDASETARRLRLNAEADARGEPQPYYGTRSAVGAMVRIRLDRMRPTLNGYYRIGV